MSGRGWSREFLKLLSVGTLRSSLAFAVSNEQGEYADAIRAELAYRLLTPDPDDREPMLYPYPDPFGE